MLKIDLSNKLVLITGATGALGRCMVRTCAQAGADVVIHYLQNKSMAEKLLEEIKQLGVKGMIVQADVTAADSIMKMQESVDKTLGSPDIIVNNAVSQYGWTNILEQSPEDYEDQFRSCVMHNVLMTKAFVPAMIEKRWGRVIGINTECAMQCYEHQSAYVAGKRGMDGVLRILAKEVGQYGITVNQVAPGWTVSEKSPSDGQNDQEYIQSVPLKRRGQDSEIANVVAFLASDLASFISGAYIPVCGGNVMPRI